MLADPPRHLTKQHLLAGLRCPSLLWWIWHEPEAQELVPDRAQLHQMELGRHVGFSARDLFPGGTGIGPAFQGVERRAEATREAMSSGVPAVFEATFAIDRISVSTDILERDGERWNLIEVKGATVPQNGKLEPQYLQDVAVQAWVLRQVGVPLGRIELMLLNRDFCGEGDAALFVRVDVTADVALLEVEVARVSGGYRAILDGPAPPQELGRHCNDPDDCAFKPRCWSGFPEHHVSTLYYSKSQWFEWAKAGHHTITELPDDTKLPRRICRRQIRAVRENRLIVEETLAKALEPFARPLAYLDFETVALPVPVWPGTRPWEQVPVQYSCHVEREHGKLEHECWLAEGPGDPRRPLAEALIASCGPAAAVVTYNESFEKGCLTRLAGALPDLAADLLSIRDRIVDLLPVVRDHIYHPEFRGSFSLKRVLPALVPELTYDEMEVGDGMTASAELYRLLFQMDEPQVIAVTREHLLEYCRQDTWAMVKLLQSLVRMI